MRRLVEGAGGPLPPSVGDDLFFEFYALELSKEVAPSQRDCHPRGARTENPLEGNGEEGPAMALVRLGTHRTFEHQHSGGKGLGSPS